ncbi:MAG: response regulator transcription factor [Deltaproteobacteria bacterium]|nr:response regulator transcription factor [Deltaproteobacteria bacterium]
MIPIRLMLIDDHQIVREGIEAMLAVEKDIQVVASVGSGKEALMNLSGAAPDVVLLDLRLPEQDGLEILGLLLAARRDLAVVMLSSADGDEAIFRALNAGAVGYLLKNTSREALAAAVRAAKSGSTVRLSATVAQRLAERGLAPPPSAREVDVLRRMALGESNKEIAASMGISESTVKNHVHSLLGKMGVTDRTQAVLLATQRGIIP